MFFKNISLILSIYYLVFLISAAKRELMLTPLSVKYSPKRSPSENLSPGLSQLLHSEENTVTRYELFL